jgi:hypothetical protein
VVHSFCVLLLLA